MRQNRRTRAVDRGNDVHTVSFKPRNFVLAGKIFLRVTLALKFNLILSPGIDCEVRDTLALSHSKKPLKFVPFKRNGGRGGENFARQAMSVSLPIPIGKIVSPRLFANSFVRLMARLSSSDEPFGAPSVIKTSHG